MRLAIACLGVALLVAACGGDDDDAPSPTGPSLTPSSPARDVDLCELLTADDVARELGYARGVTVPHDGPGSLHFCTVYLEVAGCEGQCTLSVDDLGAISESNLNTPDVYRETIESANSDATMTVTDAVLGENSWLAVISTLALPAWKLLYFQVNGAAFTLSGPRVPDYSPEDAQMIALGQAIVAKLR